MGILNAFRRLNRKHWFVCYNCMQKTNHDEVKSIFYYDGPPTMVVGRPLTPCPRCQQTNTISFQKLKDDKSDSQLWGLERAARRHPRSFFQITPESVKPAN